MGVLVLRESGEAVNGWDVSVDDLPSALNELQARDLETILTMTPERRRVEVALAFVGWEVPTWATAAGLQHVTTSYDSVVTSLVSETCGIGLAFPVDTPIHMT